MELGNKLNKIVSEKSFKGVYGGVEINTEAVYNAVDFIFEELEHHNVSIYKEMIEVFVAEAEQNYSKLEYFEFSELESQSINNIYDKLFQVQAEHGGNFKNTNKLITQSIMMDELKDSQYMDIDVLLPTKETRNSKLAQETKLGLTVQIGVEDNLVLSYSFKLSSENGEIHYTKKQLEKPKEFNENTITEISKIIVEEVYENNPFI